MPSHIKEVDIGALAELTMHSDQVQEPVVVRGLATGTPVVRAAALGDDSLLAYLAKLAQPCNVTALLADDDAMGKFGYSADMSSFNFKRTDTTFSAFLGALSERKTPSGSVAVQGVRANHAVPGFAQENYVAALPDGGEFRLWLGTQAVVAIHSDPAPNVAYVAAGRRRFTVFAPEEVGNLYMGPFDPVPNGTQISLADPLAPDPARFPRFMDALEQSRVTELAPGDAIFIPTGWYHHVEATAPLNLLVNYWWRTEQAVAVTSPWDALMHGFMSLRGLSPAERRVWRSMFDHYIFASNGDPGGHLPAEMRGILAEPTPRMIENMRQAILRALAGDRR